MATLGREDWIDAGLAAITEGGVGLVTVEGLADRLGVTKGSFYWHFSGRPELFAELLAAFETRGTDAIIERVDAAGQEPRRQLRTLIDVTLTDPRDGRRATTAFADDTELAIRAWAGTDPLAADVVARVDRRRLDYLRDLLVRAGRAPSDAQQRAEIFYRILIGEFAWRSHGGSALSSGARAQIAALLLGEPDGQ